MRITLTLAGTEYTAAYDDLANMTIGEIRTIKRETGLSITELLAKIFTVKDDEDLDMDVLASLVYLVVSRSAAKLSWADVERIPLVELAAGLSVVPDEPVPVDAALELAAPSG
ncbi:MAG: hypothetical protein ACRDQZ_07235 [Mycobacteriales bacterium]